MEKRTTFVHAVATFVLLSVVSSSMALANSKLFVAKRKCIIHKEPKASSASLGRLEVGQTARLIQGDSTSKWIKVNHNDVQGWVYRPRGKIITQDILESEAEEMHFWFGNIHSHTSEGSHEGNIDESTHEDAFLYAMNDAEGNLDFLAVTPHNHLVEADTYAKLVTTTRDSNYYIKGRFVPIAGQKYSSISKGNHVNVFELDAWIDPDIVANGEFDKLFLNFIPEHETGYTFAQFNHPYSSGFTAKNGTEYGRDDFESDMDRWIEATDKYVQAIEIISAPDHEEQTDRPHYGEHNTRVNAWLWALNEGWHLGPTANQDNHRPNWGSASDSRTVVIAEELDLGAIMAAFRARRFYASEDSTMEVTFKAGNSWMGSEVDIGEFGGFSVKLRDEEEPAAVYTVDLYFDSIGGGALKHSAPPLETVVLSDGEEGYFYPTDLTGDTYYFIKVTQSKTNKDHNGTEDNAWTSPIWLKGDIH